MLRVALCQMNPTVGDIPGNQKKILAGLERARAVGAHLVVFPEMALTGCPLEELGRLPDFMAAVQRALAELAPATQGLSAVVGTPLWDGGLRNGAVVFHDGAPVGPVEKRLVLPGSPGDEARFFLPGSGPRVFRHLSFSFGVVVGEDLSLLSPPAGGTPDPVPEPAAVEPRLAHGSDFGSPGEPSAVEPHLWIHVAAPAFFQGHQRQREAQGAALAGQKGTPLLVCQLVGGQDGWVFAGQSFAVDGQGRLVARARAFSEDFLVVDLSPGEGARPGGGEEHSVLRAVSPASPSPGPASAEEELYQALVLGTRDYAVKNGFRAVGLGLSGGLDSALVAAIAADALGPGAVTGVYMPSRYSSTHSREDARQLARNLGIRYLELDMDGVFQAFLDLLDPVLGRPGGEAGGEDTTEENLQPRIRGTLLMALSNRLGWLVLTASNKSEAGVGYTTLYGDMAGGLAVLSDVPKTWVFRLARYRNALGGRDVIPRRILEKPPSAELRPDQKDTDSLPEYGVLDPILQAFVEENLSLADIARRGLDSETVQLVARMILRSEYKRRQAAPGIKVSPRAFGKDWRMPITNGFSGG